ncbi:MAG: serine/threonine-protein kinase [Acetobacteraceae bacterium]
MTEPAPPARIGRYRPLAILGQGAIGTVYRAHDPRIEREVAIKLVRTEALDPATREDYLLRFRTEAQAAGRCTHPAIVALFDFAEDEGTPYLVMELVEGHTLQRLLVEPGLLLTFDRIDIILQILDGLAAAHALGITHRDIKPANIIVTPAGRAKITDFGVARLDRGAMTETGAIVGTPSYMAPEQVVGPTVDQRADLFAVAAILYEMTAGRPPFAGRNLSETVLRLTGPEPADPAPVAAGGGQAILPVLRQALAKDPARRFPTAAAFAASLRAAMAARAAAGSADTVVLGTITPGAVAAAGVTETERQRLEADLARHVGPIATILVREALATASASGLDTLVERLSRHVPPGPERIRFQRAHASRAEPAPEAGRGPPTGDLPAPVAAGAVAGVPPSAETLQALTALLAPYIGPIAAVLVRREAEVARDGADLLTRLAAHLRRSEDATAFRRKAHAQLRL